MWILLSRPGTDLTGRGRASSGFFVELPPPVVVGPLDDGIFAL